MKFVGKLVILIYKLCVLELFPAEKDRGSESIFELVDPSLGSFVSSLSTSNSLAVSLDIIACGLPRANLSNRRYQKIYYCSEEGNILFHLKHKVKTYGLDT